MKTHSKGPRVVKNFIKSSNRFGKEHIVVFTLEFLWKKVDDTNECFCDTVFVAPVNYQTVTVTKFKFFIFVIFFIFVSLYLNSDSVFHLDGDNATAHTHDFFGVKGGSELNVPERHHCVS